MNETEKLWNVFYTEDAQQDLQGVFDYIKNILLEPAIATNQTNRIMDAVDSLSHMPFRHRLFDKEPWHSKGLRVLSIDNYLIFYLPIETQTAVAIIRIMYAGRDTENQLNKTK